MPAVGLLFLLLLVPAVGFTARVFQRAAANDRILPSREDWKPRLPALFTSRRAAPAAAGGKAKAAKAKAGGKAKARKPQTVRTIITQGVTDNWVARQKHRRENGHVPWRRRVFDRLVFPRRRRRKRQKPPPEAETSIPPAPDEPVVSPDPVPSPSEGTPMTEITNGTTSSNGGSASGGTASGAGGSGGGGSSIGGGGGGDLGSALTRVISEGESGGLQSKTRAALVLGEGHRMSGEYLQQYSRHLQEVGEYPAFAWEPVRQAAAMISAAATKLTEHGNAMQTIARTPMGEAVGKAPAKPELDKA